VIELTQINIYPVKSCKGTSLSRAKLTAFGLENDRNWMVVQEDGTFLSQRTVPTMSLIEPTLTDDTLQLKAPGSGIVEVPRNLKSSAPAEVRIWEDTCSAVDCGDAAATWLTEFLKVRCRLVAMGKTFNRAVSAKYSTKKDQVSFADAFPFLLISSASLRDLNERLDLPVPMNRFRPNLVVSGCDPYAEDGWGHLAIGSLTFRVSKPCARCTVPSVDQTTGVSGTEPLATLATYRKFEGGKVYFGQNLVNEQKSGELVLGNEVIVLQPT
jgi:uncharacterized protein YcbX